MAELGLAILFIGILAGLDRRRRDSISEQIRRFLDWLEKSQSHLLMNLRKENNIWLATSVPWLPRKDLIFS